MTDYILENDAFRAVVRSRGGELISLRNKSTGREYMWQGKRGVWEDHCYHIFPFAGRLKQDGYLCRGRRYTMPLHGFVRDSELSLQEKSETALTFDMTENLRTLESYPFRFAYRVRLLLTESGISVSYRAENRGGDTMYCQFGAHPGFRVPLDDGASFENYRLRLDGEGTERLFLDRDRLYTGRREKLSGNLIGLSHKMFAECAQMYRGCASQAILERPDGRHALRIRFEGFPYLVLWSKGEEELLCIEPWGSRTVKADGSEDSLEQREDLLALAPGTSAERNWSIEVIS